MNKWLITAVMIAGVCAVLGVFFFAGFLQAKEEAARYGYCEWCDKYSSYATSETAARYDSLAFRLQYYLLFAVACSTISGTAIIAILTKTFFNTLESDSVKRVKSEDEQIRNR